MVNIFSLKNKIVALIVILTLLQVAIGMLPVSKLKKIGHEANIITNNILPTENELSKINKLLSTEISQIEKVFLYSILGKGNNTNKQNNMVEKAKTNLVKIEQDISTELLKADELLQSLVKNSTIESERKILTKSLNELKEVQELKIDYRKDISQNILNAYGSNITIEKFDIIESKHAEIYKRINYISETLSKNVRDHLLSIENYEIVAERQVIYLLVFSLILGIILSSFLIFGFNKKINKAIEIARNIAQLKLDNKFDVKQGDEIGTLLSEMNQMQKNLVNATKFEEQIEALGKTQAVVEFDINGNLITANENFLKSMKYSLDEVKGKNHSLFVNPEYQKSDEYRRFWDELRSGKTQAGEYWFIGKDGTDVWFYASFSPIIATETNQIIKILVGAIDITKDKLKNSYYSAQIDAIGKTQAFIEFDQNGTIIDANENFLGAMNYKLDEIKGKHHSIFVTNEYKNSNDYKTFWDKLASGVSFSGEFLRVDKQGNNVWISASYSPIFNFRNEVFRVVKFASDITDQKKATEEIGKALDKISHGDFSYKINNNFTNEFNIIRDNVNKMSTSLEQVTTNAVRLASVATKQTQDGRNIITEVISAMSDIQESSKKINDIVASIDGVANQTNLLALNAAIEAARAGDSGRGFAVVASEVRDLAQSTVNLANEIKSLLSKSKDKISSGTELVQSSGDVLLHIVESVSEVNKTLQKISKKNDAGVL